MNELILQWNINGYFPQKEHLDILIRKYNPTIICLQETNFKNDYCSALRQCNSFHKNRIQAHHASGGAATFIKKNFASQKMYLNTNLEAVAVSVVLASGRISICNVYIPNSYVLSLKDLEDLISQLPKPFILLGDLNSHHYIWGSHKIDQRGHIIEKLLENHNISLLNNNQPTHFNSSYNSFSAIDLSICSSSVALSYS